MIPHGVEVFVALDTIDLRWSFDRLGALVADRIGREVRGGALFVFFGRRRDAVKILFADETGLCLFYNQPSSHYTSSRSRRGPWSPLCRARLAAARSSRRSQRLQCFMGRVAGSS
jgi:transposase